MKITISGTLGSGKSTVAKILCEKLDLKKHNSGGFMRKIAENNNMTLNELQVVAEKEKWVDDEIDKKQKELGEKEDNFVFEGRLGYHFIPDSFKIFLKTSTDVAADRILLSMQEQNDEREKEGLTKDKDEIIKSLERRRESEKKRYKEFYDLDYEDENNYDLVVDTSNISAEEVADIIVNKIKE